MLILKHVRKLFKWRMILVRSSKKAKVNVKVTNITKVNVKVNFMFDRVEKKQHKIKVNGSVYIASGRYQFC